MDKQTYHKEVTGRGPNISASVKEVIAEVYLKDTNQVAKEVLDKVHKRLRKEGVQLSPGWPGLSIVQKELTKIRLNDTEEAKKGLEATWSLGASVENNITSDANEDLLKIWRWCLVVGREFTIREAQWVARLRGLVPFNNLLLLASKYALRERTCKALRMERIDTSDLDAHVAFGDGSTADWRYGSAIRTGAIHRPPKVTQNELRYRLSRPDALEDMTAGLLMSVHAGFMVEYTLSFSWGPKQELPEDADMVYAMWLRALSKGPKWQNMSTEAKQTLARRLYEEVAAASKENEVVRQAWQYIFEGFTDEVEYSPPAMDWIPSPELLEEVGLVVNPGIYNFVCLERHGLIVESQKQKEAQNERTHNQEV